jgi:hypothetical protein
MLSGVATAWAQFLKAWPKFENRKIWPAENDFHLLPKQRAQTDKIR